MSKRITVAVSVGTDHHPFNRLMDWLQDWLSGRDDVDLLLQHGPAHQVSGAAVNAERLPKSQLLEWLDSADLVVLQGGPGGIIDALRLGHRPVVVPRLAAFGEVVDDHQVAFCRELNSRGLVAAAETREALHRLLEAPPFEREPGVDLTQSLAADGPETIAGQLAELPGRLDAGTVNRRLRQVIKPRRGA